MNVKKVSFEPKNRRGLSSVVGALFFTVLMVAGFSVLSLALDAQTDIVTTQRMVSDVEIKKQQEQFGIIASVDGNKILDVSINNQGQNSAEISSVWIVNKTLPNQPVQRFEVNYDDAYIPSGFTSNILESQTLQMVDDTYDIKVVSALGTIKIIELTVGSGGGGGSGLRAELITDPPDVIIGQNVTVALMVTNTGIDTINNVQPDPITFTPTGSGAATAFSSHTPDSVDLNGGASVLFSWDYQVTGDSGDELSFSSIARGDGAASNTVSDISILREPTDGGSGGSGGEEIVVRNELFGKPQIFMIFPNPIGWDNNNRALWGVMVANPTDQPIEVSKVAIVAMSPRATSSDKIFAPECEDQSSPLDPRTVSPTTDRWSCPESNQLQWKNTNNPQVIQPRSVHPFLVEIGTESIGSTTGEANLIPIQVTVASTLGQFGKAGYLSTMAEENVAMPNVFLSTAVGTTNSANIIGTVTGITEGASVTFNASIGDFDTGSGNEIKSDSRLIINIPKDWTYTGINSFTGFDNPPDVQTFPDGSTQIIGTLSNDLTGSGDVARTIQFTATAPDVTNAKMYVMHILADGIATGSSSNNYTIGPLSESVLQVCPTSGCP